jgi:hypothetical protein
VAVGLTELVLDRRGRIVVMRFAAAIGVYALLSWLQFYTLQHGVHGAAWLQYLFLLGRACLKVAVGCYPAVLGSALLLTLGGTIVRSIASTRVQEGHSDPLDRVRAWAGRHPQLRKLPILLPGAVLASWLRHDLPFVVTHWSRVPHPAVQALAIVAIGAGLAIAMGRTVLLAKRALLAPTHSPASPPPDAERVEFSAIALTAFTRAATAGIAGLVTVAVVATLVMLATPSDFVIYWWAQPLQWALAALAAATAGLLVAFCRVARVSVGIDGIRTLHGTGSRFVAYRDLDAVHASRAEVQLMRGERVVLRLQMHSADAKRGKEVAGRIRDAIAAAREQAGAGAEHVVRVESAARVATMTEGGVDYRSPAVSREHLWAVVEGASADGETRMAAARALAVTLTDEDKPRMRAVAARVADPRLRVALDALVEEEEMPPVRALV